MNRILLAILIIIAAVAACASTEESASRHPHANSKTADGFSQVVSPGLPHTLTFADQEFNFDRTDMYERLDRELTSVAYSHGATLLLIKRANKYFPLMSPILQKNGIPLDFLYLACVESSLNQRAVSPAKAAGFWQFMPETARQYGLEVNDSVDERFHLEKATAAASRYLKDAYKRYGNWESVAASYNAGMGRISRELNKQNQKSAFDLYLNEETSRYMFRIFATKLILENPTDYGYQLTAEQLYYPVETKEIEVDSTITDLTSWAAAHGTSYQWIKELNPWLRGRGLPNKSGKKYQIKIPAEKKSVERGSSKGKVYNPNVVCR